jgi:hypothetical protein
MRIKNNLVCHNQILKVIIWNNLWISLIQFPIHHLYQYRIQRFLRRKTYGTVGPAPKKMSHEVRALESSNLQVAYIEQQVPPDKTDKEHAMKIALSYSLPGYDDGINTNKIYKDDLGHKDQASWWESMINGLHGMIR